MLVTKATESAGRVLNDHGVVAGAKATIPIVSLIERNIREIEIVENRQEVRLSTNCRCVCAGNASVDYNEPI